MATDDLNTSNIVLVGFLGAVVVFVVIVLLVVVFYQVEAQQQLGKDINLPPEEITKLVNDQHGRLAGYDYDPDRQVYRIPIRAAMVLVVDEISADARSNGLGTVQPEPKPRVEPPPPAEPPNGMQEETTNEP